jgi:hypothetical protein
MRAQGKFGRVPIDGATGRPEAARGGEEPLYEAAPDPAFYLKDAAEAGSACSTARSSRTGTPRG